MQLPIAQAINLAGQQIDAGRLQSAGVILQQILQRQPGNPFATHLLGIIAHRTGRTELAVELIGRAIGRLPRNAQFHANRGEMLRLLGRLDEAIFHGEQAIKLDPKHATAFSNLGIAYFDKRNYARAMDCQKNALALNPSMAQALNNLGSIQNELKDTESAIGYFRKVLEIVPGHTEAMNNLGFVLQETGQIEAAIASYRRALDIDPGYTECHSNMLLALNYSGNPTPSEYLEHAHQFGRNATKRIGTRYSTWSCPANTERLRIGLVSGDLRRHSVGYFMEGLIAHLDPARIELFAYPTHHGEDELTACFRPYLSAWKPLVGMSDEAAARLIHSDGIHILIDLSGHTARNRLPLFAWKPAPLQVTWLGLPSTTGVAEIDYVLGDAYALPIEYEKHFTEAVWRMPESCLCLAAPDSTIQVAPLPALTAGHITFGSFNNLTKINDTVISVWSRILKAMPGSRLIIKTKQLSDPAVCANTTRRFAGQDIPPERLQLGGMLATRDEHLAAYNNIDIALDTFPYPGVTTSLEALWMGVPVLSKRGDRFLSSTASSIAHNAGLPDWNAADEDDYIAKAIEYASHQKSLATLRAGLRQQVLSSPLFDVTRFTRNFEDALWDMWKRHQTMQGKPA